jgi:hypothetical protein
VEGSAEDGGIMCGVRYCNEGSGSGSGRGLVGNGSW